jgi:hypothetical protein
MNHATERCTELAQGNESSPPWKSLCDNPLPYHDAKCIPSSWTWVKPHDGEQQALIDVLDRWLCDQRNGKPGLKFYNVHGAAAGLKMGKGRKQSGRKRAGDKDTVANSDDSEDSDEDDDEDEGSEDCEGRDAEDNNTAKKTLQPKPQAPKRKRTRSNAEDFSEGEFCQRKNMQSSLM